ncbi:NYN domain-containing protein [Candidatus Saccharibacteria bacterium]|nr:NYN domain-containing protein [Candidatus Saccharibacteria bacterium]
MNKLYIDGENFLFKAKDILKAAKLIKGKPDITHLKMSHLRNILDQEGKIEKVQFYAAKLHKHHNSRSLLKKSELLIESQRRLKRYLTNDVVDFILSGHVRLQSYIAANRNHSEEAIFKEKGVDVRLAIDMLTDVCDGKVKVAFLASSDSDMVPVVREMQARKCRVVYVGFATQPNQGLIATCDQSILFRDEEIIESFKSA